MIENSEAVALPESLSGSRLRSEIDYLNSNKDKLGLDSSWWKLENYSVTSQVDMLLSSENNYNLNDWLSDTEEDINGYILEYLAQKLTFPLFYGIENINSENRLVARNYKNKPVVDTIAEEERQGAVKSVFRDSIEPFLIGAPNGSVAIMTSPSGESGLYTDKGNSIIFPDSQTYIFQKDAYEVKGFTIRTDFNLDEHREFIRITGANSPDSNNPRDFVLSPILIDSSLSDIDISMVVGGMNTARQKVSERTDALDGRGWNEIYDDIKNRDVLWNLEESSKLVIKDFNDFVIDGFWTEDNRDVLELALALTILQLANKILNKNKGFESKDIISELESSSNFRIDYQKIIKQVEEIGGCAGGGLRGLGSMLSEVLNNGNPRMLNVLQDIVNADYDFDRPGPCRECGSNESCGPCRICRDCDVKMRLDESVSFLGQENMVI